MIKVGGKLQTLSFDQLNQIKKLFRLIKDSLYVVCFVPIIPDK